MKVLLVNSVLEYGSTGKIVNQIYKLVKESGNECKVAYGRINNSNIDESDLIKIGNSFDVKAHATLSRITDKAGFYSKSVTKDFINAVKEYDPDIINLHNIHGYYLNIEILFDYIKSYNKKVVWTFHDCWPYTGHCANYDYANCSKWKTQCSNCPELREYPKSILRDNSYNNYINKKEIFSGVKDLIIVTPSKWLKNEVKKSFLKDYEVKVINNGIDTSVFKPTQSNLEEEYKLKDKKVILGVASVWDRKKGLNYFLELNDLLKDEYKIVLIGLNKKQLEELPDSIIGISRTNNAQELAAWYTLAYAYVNPTLGDNYPTTNIEAICCGTPAITFNTGGSPEIALKYGSVTEEKSAMAIKDSLEKFKYINKVDYELFNYFNSENRYKDYLSLFVELSKL